MKHQFTFIDLEPIEYEVLTDILHEEHIFCKIKEGPDYDNYIMKPGYNVTVCLEEEKLNFIKYLYEKRVDMYKKVKTMYETPQITATINSANVEYTGTPIISA